jgi:hypothetical protein
MTKWPLARVVSHGGLDYWEGFFLYCYVKRDQPPFPDSGRPGILSPAIGNVTNWCESSSRRVNLKRYRFRKGTGTPRKASQSPLGAEADAERARQAVPLRQYRSRWADTQVRPYNYNGHGIGKGRTAVRPYTGKHQGVMNHAPTGSSRNPPPSSWNRPPAERE